MKSVKCEYNCSIELTRKKDLLDIYILKDHDQHGGTGCAGDSWTLLDMLV